MKFGAGLAIPPKLIPIMAMVFVITLGWGMMVPVLPLVAEKVGGKASDSGFLLSAFGAARLVMSIPAGAASDRFGRRVLMVVGVVLVCIGAFGAMLGWTILTVAAALFVMGSGSSCYVTAALAAVADLSEGGGRGRLMSYYQSGVLAGVSVGPVAGGLLVGFFDVDAPFLVQGVVAGIGGVVAALVLRETRQPGAVAGSGAGGFMARIRLLASPALLVLCTLAFGIYCSRVVATWQVVPILVKDSFGYDTKMIGLLLTAGALGNLSALPIAGYVIDRFGARTAIIGGGLAVLCGLIPICLPPTQFSVWASVLVLGAAGSTMATACAAFAASVSKAAHGITMGTLRMSGDLGLVSGPIILTAILTHSDLDMRQSFTIVTVFMGLMLLAFFLVGKPPSRVGQP